MIARSNYSAGVGVQKSERGDPRKRRMIVNVAAKKKKKIANS
jgi:hypothetical protein